MQANKPQKVVYLLGAGATHAEVANTEKDPENEVFFQTKGLLIKHVSDRVMAKAIRHKKYIKDIQTVSSAGGSPNIELLISLLETSRIKNWEYKSTYLKKLVKEDIEGVLQKSNPQRFYLHKALLELHNHAKTKVQEELVGLISLNYDDILDTAYKSIFKIKPNYAFPKDGNTGIPLLKLHGSFNWQGIRIRGRKRDIDIIPLGANKNYLHIPYNFIWNEALEKLIDCDILRVIGCSLNQNDVHLIDLLFKAHIEKERPLAIQIISSKGTGEHIRKNYGFFSGIQTLEEIEPPLLPGPIEGIANPFQTWLTYKSSKMLGKRVITHTSYLKKLNYDSI